jgi:hypothetical protein
MEGDTVTEPIHIISLGAGVQSSTMALMAAKGEIRPMPAAAIFADTQDEPKEVYDWLDWLESELPFKVHRVTRGKLSDRALTMSKTRDGRLYSKTDIPFFTRNNLNGTIGKIIQRGCTRDFKLDPLMRKARELGNIKRGQKTVGVVQWIGISLDEIYRMKPSRDKWAENRWPLVDLRINRHDCLMWMKRHKYPQPPRSACIYCPFHNDSDWRRLKAEAPQDFEKAVKFEEALQEAKSKSQNFKTTPFLHRSCKPLAEVDLSTDEENGQTNFFNNECEGMCGV